MLICVILGYSEKKLGLWKRNYLTFWRNLSRNDFIQGTLRSVYPLENQYAVEHLYVTTYSTCAQRDDVQSLLLGLGVSWNIVYMCITAWVSKYHQCFTLGIFSCVCHNSISDCSKWDGRDITNYVTTPDTFYLILLNDSIVVSLIPIIDTGPWRILWSVDWKLVMSNAYEIHGSFITRFIQMISCL